MTQLFSPEESPRSAAAQHTPLGPLDTGRPSAVTGHVTAQERPAGEATRHETSQEQRHGSGRGALGGGVGRTVLPPPLAPPIQPRPP